MFATSSYVANILGQKFVEPPMLDLAESFSDSSPVSPLLFILSAGKHLYHGLCCSVYSCFFNLIILFHNVLQELIQQPHFSSLQAQKVYYQTASIQQLLDKDKDQQPLNLSKSLYVSIFLLKMHVYLELRKPPIRFQCLKDYLAAGQNWWVGLFGKLSSHDKLASPS